MKKIQHLLFGLLLVALAFPQHASAQYDPPQKLEYVVEKVFKPLSMSKDELNSAESVADLREQFKPSWVKKYLTVEILTIHNGKERKAVHTEGTLSKEQKNNMQTADAGQDISIKINYIPENTLKNNPPKEMSWSFLVYPEKKAAYPYGQEKLNQYLKESAVDNIPEGLITGYALAAVKFTVTENGDIINPKVAWSSKDDTVDELLLETVRNMPKWIPAEYADGTKVAQDFAFAVGNMESCAINVLNTRPLPREEDTKE